MWLQYRRNPYPRSYCGKGTNQDGTRKDKGSKGMEDTDESEEHGKFPRVRKLLLTIHPKLQPHGKTIEQVKRQEGLGVERRIPKGIWRTQGENNESTGTGTTQKRRKI